MSVMESLAELEKLRVQHGKTMYKLALEHAINMIEIDAELGLAQLKEQLAELEKEEQSNE